MSHKGNCPDLIARVGHRVHVMAVRAPRKNIDIMIPCLCLGALAMLTGSLAALGKPDITFILGARQLCQRRPVSLFRSTFLERHARD